MTRHTMTLIVTLFISCFILILFWTEVPTIYGKDKNIASESSSFVLADEEEEKELPPPKHYQVKKTTSAVKVDGVLDEDAWKDAAVLEDFYEWLPGDNIWW